MAASRHLDFRVIDCSNQKDNVTIVFSVLETPLVEVLFNYLAIYLMGP